MLNNRKKYLLVKVIEAEPMTLGEFYKKQGYNIPPLANVYNIDGYIVYHNGKTEWYSLDEFNPYTRELSNDSEIEVNIIDKNVCKCKFYSFIE